MLERVGGLAAYVAGVPVTQGQGVGDPFPVLPWERRFLGKVERTSSDLVLTMTRGNGKTTLTAAIADVTLRGPLRLPRAARFPDHKTLEQIDFKALQGVSKPKLRELASCDYIDRGDDVVLVGPIGTGKTHLAIALGIEAAKRRRRVWFRKASDLVRDLIEARDQRELGRLQQKLQRVDLLICDELGFVPFDRAGGELLFNVFADRYERRSTIVTSNLAFSEWVRVFGDEKLTTALLDRLSHHAHILATKGASYRTRLRKTHREARPHEPQPDRRAADADSDAPADGCGSCRRCGKRQTVSRNALENRQTGFPQLPQPLLLLTQGDRDSRTLEHGRGGSLSKRWVAHFPSGANTGRYRFRAFTASDTEMGNLFEAFLRGFLRRERPELRVPRGNTRISFDALAPPGAPRVPGMLADIFVPARDASEGSRSVIVETKCVNDPFRDGKLRSDHLYQLWAYLTNYSRANPADRSPAGLLLYATDGQSFRHAYDFPGHSIEVRSLDLGQGWPDLRRDLLRFADELAEVTGARVRPAA